VLDPIDGTRAFLTGRPLFGTLIGLLHHGEPVLGLIDQPVTRERWVGVAGQGTTFRGPLGGTIGARACESPCAVPAGRAIAAGGFPQLALGEPGGAQGRGDGPGRHRQLRQPERLHPARLPGRRHDAHLRHPAGASPDEASTEYAHLAKAMEIPADRKGIVFELNEKARWHDGKPVTAEDAVWTFNTLREKGRPFFRAYWADVAEVVAEGPHRLVFRFSTDGNRELGLILGQMPVLPKHFWEGKDFAQPSLEVPLGSGPYKVDRFDPGRSITYRRVADYWGRDLPTMKGTNNFDTLRYEYFRDGTVALEAFKAGQVDFRQENVAKDWATAYDFPAFRRGLVKREEIRTSCRPACRASP
jgi:hypothetical protein